MTIFYSPSLNGFYTEEDHGARIIGGKSNPGCRIPKDGVEVSPELHQALMDAQGRGQIIAMVDGLPAAVDRPQPTTDELWVRIRMQRNRLLAETDFGTDTPKSVVDKFKKYRQALRDIPQTFKSPADVKWPIKPE